MKKFAAFENGNNSKQMSEKMKEIKDWYSMQVEVVEKEGEIFWMSQSFQGNLVTLDPCRNTLDKNIF